MTAKLDSALKDLRNAWRGRHSPETMRDKCNQLADTIAAEVAGMRGFEFKDTNKIKWEFVRQERDFAQEYAEIDLTKPDEPLPLRLKDIYQAKISVYVEAGEPVPEYCLVKRETEL